MDILGPGDLLQLINHIKGAQLLSCSEAKLARAQAERIHDLSEVKGQKRAKRFLEIMARGHNLMLIGPPGSFKTMLASCLPWFYCLYSPGRL